MSLCNDELSVSIVVVIIVSSLSVVWPSGCSWDRDFNFCEQITIFLLHKHILYRIIWSSCWVEVKWAHVRWTNLYFTSPSGWIWKGSCRLQFQLSVILLLHKRWTLMAKWGDIEPGGKHQFMKNWGQLHWVQFTMSLVTKRHWAKLTDLFAPNHWQKMLEEYSFRKSTCLQRAVSFASFPSV